MARCRFAAVEEIKSSGDCIRFIDALHMLAGSGRKPFADSLPTLTTPIVHLH